MRSHTSTSLLLALLQLLDDGHAQTLALGKAHHRLVPGANHERVGSARGEFVPRGILHVHNLERALVLLAARDHADATGVAAAGEHHERARLVLDELGDLVRRDVHHHRVVLADQGVGVPDRAPVVKVHARHTLVPETLLVHLAQLVLRLERGDAVHDEAPLRVVDDAEVLVGLVDGHDVHDAGGVALVAADLAVHLDQSLLEDGGHLLVRQRVLQAVAEDEAQGEALALLVRAGGGLRGEDAAELVEHPVARGIEPLEVLLGSARHLRFAGLLRPWP
mmetsp:Transcript_14841/g.63688  ORF Transcript_14841/g.63688 Transcript_14841/m.63688 type:complete len:278 (+) Transcript_14841:122-955(+)